MLLPDYLIKHATERPNATAIILPHDTPTTDYIIWSDFINCIVSRIKDWQRDGVLPGTFIENHIEDLPNTICWVETNLAALCYGVVFISKGRPEDNYRLPGSCLEQAEIQKQLEQLSALEREQRLASNIEFLQNLRQLLHPDQLATIVTTSGTTGSAVGVQLTQGNLVANAAAIAAAFADKPHGRRLAWLPMQHLFARTADLYCWLVRGSELVLVQKRYLAIANAQYEKPDFINGVPYFYDKLMRHALQSTPSVSAAHAKLRELLGGKIRFLIAGGAPLPAAVRDFYEAAGLPLGSGYGLTEAGPVVATETLAQRRAGSVGKPLPGVEVRIDDQGQILVRGPSVSRGYHNQPELTAQRFRDGWLHTGDLGYIDSDGYLFITGRLKEVLVLSTGRKVNPQLIETELLDLPLIQQVMVVGEGRPYLTALIVPNPDVLKATIKKHRLWVWSKHRALHHPTIHELLRAQIQERLQHREQYERIEKFTLIGRGWTPESGELTETLKLKREVIAQNFAKEIERLYV